MNNAELKRRRRRPGLKRRRPHLVFQLSLMAVGVLALVGWSGLTPLKSRSLATAPPAAAAESTFTHRRALLAANSSSAPGCEEVEVTSTSDFPPTGFTVDDMLNNGAILFHIVVIMYTFAGLAIVCDEFFNAGLEAICEHLALKDDVAGATFMAAGGSAPELFTSIMGVFVAHSDIGFGTIVGSAVFNVLFVIGVCAFVAPNLVLTWYPLTRDSVCYCTGIIVLVGCLMDKQIHWYESLILLACYAGYVTIMYYNDQVHDKLAAALKESKERTAPKYPLVHKFATSGYFNKFIYAVIIANLCVILLDLMASGRERLDQNALFAANWVFNGIFLFEFLAKNVAFGFIGYWRDPLNSFDGLLAFLILVEILLNSDAMLASGMRIMRMFKFLRAARSLRIVRLYRVLRKSYADNGAQTNIQWLNSDVVPMVRTSENSEAPRVEWRPSALPASPEGSSPTPAKLPPIKSNAVAPLPEEKDGEDGFEIEARARELNPVRPLRKKDARRASVVGPKALEHNLNFAKAHEGKTSTEIEESVGRPSGSSSPVQGGGEIPGDVEKGFPADKEPVEEEEEDDEEDGPYDPFDIPEDYLGRFIWAAVLPLSLAMWCTIPDCRRERFAKWWPVTFFNSIIWIAILAFFMVWMASEIGIAWQIPEPVMGLTVLAGGTSIPDALSSVAVARRGHGDMAVSSSIGSNVFDILIGLPVPWFIGSLVYQKPISITSEGLTLSVMTLFIMVALVIAAINLEGWKLTMRLGYMMIILYFLFLSMSLLLEYGLILSDC